jgi:hypothetical protein
VIGTICMNSALYDDLDVEDDWEHAVCVDTNKQTLYDNQSKTWLSLKDFPLYRGRFEALVQATDT